MIPKTFSIAVSRKSRHTKTTGFRGRTGPLCTSAAVLVQRTNLLLVGNDTVPISILRGGTSQTSHNVIWLSSPAGCIQSLLPSPTASIAWLQHGAHVDISNSTRHMQGRRKVFKSEEARRSEAQMAEAPFPKERPKRGEVLGDRGAAGPLPTN